MSNRLGGFIAGQNINVSIGTVAFSNTPDLTFGSTAGTPVVGTPVQFTTTGTLPTGFSLNTTYYVISVSSNTCQVSTTQGGSATTYTNGTGSGTHTAVTQRAFNPYAGAPDTVEYLVVAGGGGAGGGGGGAGGLLTASNYAVATGTALTVTVGAGGGAATNGSNSVFSGITATGGGRGGLPFNTAGSGGSGGGAGQDVNTSSGAGTSGQGNAGGASNRNSYGGAGGGGGAGSVGGVPYIVDSTKSSGGNGGAGVCSTITGQRVFYAGGGGGGINAVGAPPFISGGLGTAGGGNGTIYESGNGSSGTSGTGGGGGGAEATAGTGGNGGSGIVIIRYPQLNSAPALVTGSPQVSYSDGYQIYTWTSSGSIIF